MVDEVEPAGTVSPRADAPADPGRAVAWSPDDTELAVALPLPPVRRARFGWSRREPSATSGESQADWRWVEEWRRGGEPTPWGPGLFLAGFAGLIIGCAVYVISTGLGDNVLLAVGANAIVALGLTPALWMSRALPVLRWVALGGALGTVIAWISLLFFPHVT